MNHAVPGCITVSDEPALIVIKHTQTGSLAMPGFLFVQDYEGEMVLSDYSFLIQHPSNGRKVLFDLGLRKVRLSVDS
jgi:hypothetical protein